MSKMQPFQGIWQNPFAAAPIEVAEDAPEGTYTYALVKSAPDVPAEEIEIEAASVEIAIRWGENLLHVAHLAPLRSFYVGEEEGRQLGCDFFLPSERLGGAKRAPVVLVANGVAHAVVLPGATGTVQLGSRRMTVAEALAAGHGAPCAELPGAHRIALPQGARARIALGDFSFEVSVGNAGRAVAGRAPIDRRGLPFTALSMALHLGLLGAMAVLMPPLALAEERGIDAEQQFLMAQAIQASAERETPRSESAAPDAPAGDPGARDAGARDAGAPGAPGTLGGDSKRTHGRIGLAGASNDGEIRLSRGEMLRLAETFGIIPMLRDGIAGPMPSSAPWGGLETLGSDPTSALGNLWGDTIDDAGGSGGLTLSGVGQGSDSPFETIRMGRIATIDNGNGRGGHGGPGYLPGNGHEATSPVTRMATPSVSGRIPRDVIQRVVRQSHGRFRACYEAGLRGNPALAGRVTAAFVIGRDGAVSGAQNAGSDLPDPAVVSCVVRAFYGLSFPAPEVGIVTVSYPILFSPGG